MRDCMNNFVSLLQAKLPCFWIQTFEENNVIEDIEEILRKDPRFGDYNIQMWSNTEGLKKLAFRTGEKQGAADPKFREPPALFSVISKQAQGEQGSQHNLWILRDFHTVITQAKTQRLVRDIAEYSIKVYNPLVVIAPSVDIPEDVAHLFRVLQYDLPDEQEIRKSIDECARQLHTAEINKPEMGYVPPTEEERERLVKACMGMTHLGQTFALRESMTVYKKLDLDFMSQNKIEMVKKTGVLDYRVPKVTLDDIGGNGAIKDWIRESIDAFSPEAEEFGIEKPKGYMSVGVPGAGKTALAEAFAAAMHVPLLELSMSKIMDKMVGSSEKKIDHALRVAKACAPCVLLLDEVEKMLGGGVASSNQSDSGITARVLQSILKFMNDNDSGVYVIMTSNDISQLPPEFTRAGRLDATWYFGLPSPEERAAIFKVHFGKKKRTVSDELLNAAVTHSDTFTGAEIEQAVKNILRKAYSRYRAGGSKDITVEDIIAGCGDVVPVARSSREKIAALERFCRGRARMASYDANGGNEEKDDEFLNEFSLNF